MIKLAHVLIPSNWTKDFDDYIDASNFAIGNVLSQKNSEGDDIPCYFANRQFSFVEKNYLDSKREASCTVINP